MKILRVNMSSLDVSSEDLAEELLLIGGRGLSAKIISKEVAPDADPLGPAAKLVIAGGPLAGTLAPSLGRVSVGCKSPLTLGIKEANAGGPAMQKLDRLGYRAIVVEGAPADGKMYILNISADGAKLEDAEDYKGMRTYDLADKMIEKCGKGSAVIAIGVAGERKYTGATVGFTDKDGRCSRHAARGGVGAVMGAKGLKAVVLNDSGTSRVEMADSAAHNKAVKDWAEMAKEDKQMLGMGKYGTPAGVVPLRSMGSMPSRNYSNEPTEGFERLSGQHLAELREKRGGSMDGCMPGCLVKCSIIYHGADGNHITSAFEYETVALLGTNLGLSEPDLVAQLDRLCDELGIDTIEVGSAMGVAASAGKLEMGNGDSFLAALDEIEKGTEFGALLANGVVATAKALGVDRIPAFKGQAIPAHDPRATKATGVTYATSPMGADHTAGLSYNNPTSPDGQVQVSFDGQIHLAMVDSIGCCTLALPGNPATAVDFFIALLKARYGVDVTAEELGAIGVACIQEELKFNETSGFHTAHPEPDFVKTEALAPINSVFDVNQDEIDKIWDPIKGA